MPLQHRSRSVAFTLIELLVVIGIIFVLMALTLPAIQRVRASWHKAACSNNLKQVGASLLSYINDHGKLPTGGGDIEEPGYVNWDNMVEIGPVPPMPRVRSYLTPGVGDHGSIKGNGAPSLGSDQDWGWAYQILPYMGSSHSLLYHLPNTDDLRIANTAIDVYFCPARWGPKINNAPADTLRHPKLIGRAGIDYAGNLGTNDVTDPRPGRVKPFCWRPDKPNFGNREGMDPATLPHYRNGVFIKSRFWHARPAASWSKFTYVDWPLSRIDIADGFAYTIAVAEKAVVKQRTVSFGWSSGYGPETLRCGSYWDMSGAGYELLPHDRPYQDPEVPISSNNKPIDKGTGFGSAHPYGMNALFLDGSVRTIAYRIQPDYQTRPVYHPRMDATPNPNQLSLFRRLLHRADGGTIDMSILEGN